ncbi:membrane-anchored protein [Neorhizobium sp. NPDC001467]|uniref:membrane-anchored protein n=1 Tax=Neorhizobium sp. NPDC001467 TaxID=3390595 RepID=UPI003D07C169
MARFKELKTLLYRRMKFRILRPSPPPFAGSINGPVVVLGSAPTSHKPAGMDSSYALFTVNASQFNAKDWGRDEPDVTFMMFHQIEGTTTNAREVRRVLSGRRTKALYVLLWRHDKVAQLRHGLAAFDYGYDRLITVDRYQRMALMDKVAGMPSWELDADSKCSNGINAVLFALYHGASAVIITGINPGSMGHSYNSAGLKRMHVDMDRQVLVRLIQQGWPIYTADPEVSANVGIPLWDANFDGNQVSDPPA